MKKLIFVLAFIFAFTAVSLWAIEPDFGGSFTFELRGNPLDPGFDHNEPAGFADISADFDFPVDDNNLVHTAIGGVSGGSVDVKDAYLKTEWGFMTTKIGDIAHDSMGYGKSSKDYETKTRGNTGAGVVVEIPLDILTVSASKTVGDPCGLGIGVKLDLDIVTLGVGYYGDTNAVTRSLDSAVTGAGTLTLGDFSAGAGFKYDDDIFAYGVGAKYTLSPVWFATGIGIEEEEVKIGADVGVDFTTWGGKVAVGIIEEIDCVNVEGWYKIGEVKLIGGYDYNAQEDDSVFVKVTADF